MKKTEWLQIINVLRIKKTLSKTEEIRKGLIYILLFGIICLAFTAGYLAVKLEKLEEKITTLEGVN